MTAQAQLHVAPPMRSRAGASDVSHDGGRHRTQFIRFQPEPNASIALSTNSRNLSNIRQPSRRPGAATSSHRLSLSPASPRQEARMGSDDESNDNRDRVRIARLSERLWSPRRRQRPSACRLPPPPRPSRPAALTAKSEKHRSELHHRGRNPGPLRLQALLLQGASALRPLWFTAQLRMPAGY